MAKVAITAQKIGKVVQVIGPVVDIEFEGGELPEIYNAVHVRLTSRTVPGPSGTPIDVIVENGIATRPEGSPIDFDDDVDGSAAAVTCGLIWTAL